MPSLNLCQFIGNLGSDPELKYTAGGAAVTTFSVAVNRNYKDPQGEWQQQTEWVRCVLWNEQAERAAEYLRKGRLVYVQGRMQTRKWTGQDGAPRYTTEIVASHFTMLDKRPDEDADDTPAGDNVAAAHRVFGDDVVPAAAAPPNGNGSHDDLDDLPF